MPATFHHSLVMKDPVSQPTPILDVTRRDSGSTEGLNNSRMGDETNKAEMAKNEDLGCSFTH